MKAIVKKSFKHGDKYYPGDTFKGSKKTVEELIDKGLLFPNYVTKEDKQAYSATNKAYIAPRLDDDGNNTGWYDVKREGNVVSDKALRKKKAIKLRDEINAS